MENVAYNLYSVQALCEKHDGARQGLKFPCKNHEKTTKRKNHGNILQLICFQCFSFAPLQPKKPG